ncbi:MAG: ATP-binding protein, partial [Myxococcales bacterium]|nr:ATP-binding protein [Myxococcales bacterium]
EQLSFVDTIRSKGELLLSLITSLLDLNKLERGQLTIEPETVDPRAVLSEIKETYLPEAEKKRITFAVECDDDVPLIKADPVRLRQILINLAGNALKFTPEQGRVAVSAHATEIRLDADEGADGFGAALMMAPESAVEFRVQDTGIGMATEELDRIFDAFYQVDGSSTREYGGAGLGLSIAKNIVDAHAGQIRVESAPGSGTCFYVVMPEEPPDP